jgi:hypothetical protein
MADRANYAILSGDTLDVYYAAWGGPTIQRELKDGPAACERFIRAQEHEPDGQLLEFAFMEGGIALDMDRRRARFFGGPGDINYAPAVQARLVERLRPIWERDGWTIAWARRYAYDLVEFLGLPGTCVEDPAYLDSPETWDSVVAPLEWVSTLVARRSGERWQLRGSRSGAGAVIRHRSQLSTAFDELPAPGPLDAYPAANLTALLLDEDRRSLVIVAPLFASLNAPTLSTGLDWRIDYSPARVQLRVVSTCPADIDSDGDYTNGLTPDGGVDINDLLAFLDAYGAAAPGADVDDDGVDPPNPDGGVDINDLLFFLFRYENGC